MSIDQASNFADVSILKYFVYLINPNFKLIHLGCFN